MWQGSSWPHILPEAIDYVKSDEYISKVRSYARKSQYSDKKIKIWNEIKEKKTKGLKRLDVYEEYKDSYSLRRFNKVWYK